MFRRDVRRDSNRRGSRAKSRASSNSGLDRGSSEACPPATSQERRREPESDFVLYVEGARDREILGCWARRAEPALARCIERQTIILGGRRPARALADFRKRSQSTSRLRGLVVLDRDERDSEEEEDSGLSEESRLELFVWSLRHIESYLLVPAAIRRVVGVPKDDLRVDRALADQIAREKRVQGHAAPGGVHAKRILGAGGSLSEALGQELRAGDIARAMRGVELHDDVRTLFRRMGALSGLVETGPEVVIRATREEI